MQKSSHILKTNKTCGDILEARDFQKATVASIIACRLKSSRLPRKALLRIGEITSVEKCIKSCLTFRNVNYTVLATSFLPEDAVLEKHTYSESVIFYAGDPENVVKRYLGIARKLMVDVIIRVTADCPFVDNAVLEPLLSSHFSSGADYSTARQMAKGTDLEIINTSALEEVFKHFPNAEYSEYMTFYFQNNPEHFKLNFVDLPEDLVRDYRLTLDYEEDLLMLRKIDEHFRDLGKPHYRLRDIFDFLDKHPEVATLNANLMVRYETDKELVKLLNDKTKIKSDEHFG